MKKIEVQKGSYLVKSLNAPGQKLIIRNLEEDIAAILICEKTGKIAVCHAITPDQIENVIKDLTSVAAPIKLKLVSLASHQDSVPMLTSQVDFIEKIVSMEKKLLFSTEWPTVEKFCSEFSIDLTGAIE